MMSELSITNLPVGGKVKFHNEVKPYRVAARNERYIICKKPFNLRKTYFYTIVDLQEGIRGACNLIFGANFETEQDCNERILELVNGEMEVSYRNRVDLHVDWVKL